MKQPVFMQGRRKYLFVSDQRGYSLLKPILDQAIQKNCPLELVFLGSSSQYPEQAETNLKQWLISQKMGTYLYAALDWKQLSFIKSLTEQIGFTEEEAQFFGHGTKYKKVFCCRCHGLSEAMEAQIEIECKHCKLELAVSDHYSTLRDAYLGYVLKL